MSEFAELFGVDSMQALKFFNSRLAWQVQGTGITPPEVDYAASVLAHYTLTPRGDPIVMAPAEDILQVLDKFVLAELDDIYRAGLKAPVILETAGSQVLLWAGFFRAQMEKKHNPLIYDELGSGFYQRASAAFLEEKDKDRAELLSLVAEHFHPLAIGCCNMHLEFLGVGSDSSKFNIF